MESAESQFYKKEIREGRFGGGGRGRPSPYANADRMAHGTLSRGNANEMILVILVSNFFFSFERTTAVNMVDHCKEMIQTTLVQWMIGLHRVITDHTPTVVGEIGETTYYNDNCQRGTFNNRQKREAVSDHKLGCSKILAALKKNRTSCSALWSPVCGTNGKTYSNNCFLCLESVKSEDILTLKHEGECPEVVHGMVRLSFTHSARDPGNMILGIFPWRLGIGPP
ncbi:hypothetical protein JD844_012368 [Phrynosoma platyrhinos]|uniref:Kazal-like domain-containing protein n=1 Tax=Phrynosoma platyrhinos TaxID=52577 RepID=A0ABQ7TKA3_PHRPL|nr:hypothetical protein JD844_012368 [Phrynosoma platyrhinos]